MAGVDEAFADTRISACALAGSDTEDPDISCARGMLDEEVESGWMTADGMFRML